MKIVFIKKVLSLFLLFLFFSVNTQAASKWGRGDLKLDDFVVEKFIEYIKGNVSSSPYKFAVSIDGLGYQYYYCSTGSSCQGGDALILEECSKNSNGAECFLFASRRTIKWKNGVNLGKGKTSKISRKLSSEEIIAKLTKLGFLDDVTYESISNKDNSVKDPISNKDYPNTLFFPNNEKIDNWKKFTKYGEGTIWPFTAWAEVRKSQNSDIYDYQWQASKKLDDAIKSATKGCNKRLKKKKSTYNNSQLCIVYFINGVESTNEEKKRFAEKFYGKKVSKISFEKNDWILNLSKLDTKEVKISDENKGDLINQIKSLKELLDAGAITQDEFDKAKKKILN